MSAPTRPALRYHGGKNRLGPWIIGHFAPHAMYVEPYGGGGNVLALKERSLSEVYNDLDSEVVNVFRVLRDPEQASSLIELLRLTPYSREEYFDAQEETAEPVERARRTIVKAAMGHGSEGATGHTGFRPGSRVGCGKRGSSHGWANFPPHLSAWIDRMRGVVIENRDALEVIAWAERQQAAEKTLYYCDPPYVHSTRSKMDYGRYRHEMTDSDHVRLSEALNEVKGMVVLSGYPSPLYDDLYRGWQCVHKGAHAFGAKDRTECLWLNPSLTERLEAVHA